MGVNLGISADCNINEDQGVKFAASFVGKSGQPKGIEKLVGNVYQKIGLAKEFGVDQLRYFLLREASFGQESNL